MECVTNLTRLPSSLLHLTVTSSDSYPSSSTVAAKKSSQPSKLVDLGAATSFASQQRQEQQEQLGRSTAVSQSSDSKGAQGDLINIFGAFSSAPAAPQPPVQQAQDKGDLFDSDFADFQGAFSSQQTPQVTQPFNSTGIKTQICVYMLACVCLHVLLYIDTYVYIHSHIEEHNDSLLHSLAPQSVCRGVCGVRCLHVWVLQDLQTTLDFRVPLDPLPLQLTTNLRSLGIFKLVHSLLAKHLLCYNRHQMVAILVWEWEWSLCYNPLQHSLWI